MSAHLQLVVDPTAWFVNAETREVLNVAALTRAPIAGSSATRKAFRQELIRSLRLKQVPVENNRRAVRYGAAALHSAALPGRLYRAGEPSPKRGAPVTEDLKQTMAERIRAEGLPVAAEWTMADSIGLVHVDENGQVTAEHYSGEEDTDERERCSLVTLAHLLEHPIRGPRAGRIRECIEELT